jgi:uncharacterized protein (TIGR03067 family)
LATIQEGEKKEKRKAEAQTHWTKGNEALAEGDYDRAISLFNQAVDLEPHNYSFLFDRARACSLKPDNNQVVKDYTEIFRLFPEKSNALAYLSRGLAYSGLEHWDEAIADYTESIKLTADSNIWLVTNSYKARSRAYRGKKRYDRAVADVSQAIQLNPNDAEAYTWRGLIYQLFPDHNDKALFDFSKAIQLDPKSNYAYAARANSYYKLGRYSEAVTDCNEAIRLAPNDAFAHSIRAAALSQARAGTPIYHPSTLPRDNRADKEKLQGEWQLVLIEKNGNYEAIREAMQLTFEGDKYHNYARNNYGTFTVDASKNPKTIVCTNKDGQVTKSIYELDGDTLKVCSFNGSERCTFKRVKK